jgi:hypothetical protein
MRCVRSLGVLGYTDYVCYAISGNRLVCCGVFVTRCVTLCNVCRYFVRVLRVLSCLLC